MMLQKVDTVTSITLACCALHNLLRTRYIPQEDARWLDHEDPVTHNVVDGRWRRRGNLDGVATTMQNRSYGTATARQVRETLVAYVNSPEGSVPWQNDKI